MIYLGEGKKSERELFQYQPPAPGMCERSRWNRSWRGGKVSRGLNVSMRQACG